MKAHQGVKLDPAVDEYPYEKEYLQHFELVYAHLA